MKIDWQDIKDEPTVDLIQCVQCKGTPDYSELAEAAFIALTFRFRGDVTDKCRKIGVHWGYDIDTSDQIAEQVFDRFWRYPFGFEKGRCGKMDLSLCFRLYLFRIAQNRFIDHHREASGQTQEIYDGTEEIIEDFPAMDTASLPQETMARLRHMQQLMEKALAMLSPKHKVIYLTYKAYEKEGYKLPRNLLAKLRDNLQLSQNSIRVYKKEAFEKVNEYLKHETER
jgi:DNA-directed RNA polymerase specialized sigma24 family protein